jgi:DNA-binding transcriptional regulator GbsR (MarR family)
MHNIQNMLNVSKRSSRAGERQFMSDIASLLAPWGMPRTAGRLFAYLLLSEAPVSLDQIAADLEMSKSGACNAARLLERFGNARRYGEAGSKRVLYGPSDNYAGPLLEQSSLLGAISRVLKTSAATVASSQAAARLAEMAVFYQSIGEALTAAIQASNRAQRR